MLNYYPAIAEAYYSNIPLVVLSADRPAHLIDIGDGQTIRQPHVFEKHIEYTTNLPANAIKESALAVKGSIGNGYFAKRSGTFEYTIRRAFV